MIYDFRSKHNLKMFVLNGGMIIMRGMNDTVLCVISHNEFTVCRSVVWVDQSPNEKQESKLLNRRVASMRALLSPQWVIEHQPAPDSTTEHIVASREVRTVHYVYWTALCIRRVAGLPSCPEGVCDLFYGSGILRDPRVEGSMLVYTVTRTQYCSIILYETKMLDREIEDGDMGGKVCARILWKGERCARFLLY